MRIIELLENKNFDDLEQFTKDVDSDQDDGLDFDLVEDLVFYMNHDDNAYRRHVYPSIVKCLDGVKHRTPTKPSVFKLAALECYKEYSKKFPVRGLPQSLEEKHINQVCKKLHDDFCTDHKEGKYKD